ncbi:MAG: PspC domain-containing protein [Bacteroidales bacterium]|nr:PspC domain-containing protein [Bacteroidales bacterium]MBN2820860.1 PspC domain-containing protein [Bacteroidales bacterium]
MKETIKVNLGGQLFNLDKDAFERLAKYLDTIENKFRTNPGEASEILEDIESRIVELLQEEYQDPSTQVVSLETIDKIIGKLGNADDMEDATEREEETYSAGSSANYQQSSGKKRLYRDIDNSVLGGVAAGLGAYMGIDKVWIRVIFIIFTFVNVVFIPFLQFSGLGLIAYVILWIIIPPARTTAQKLEMSGKAVNVENIKDSVKKEYEKVKTGVSNIPNSKEYKNIESAVSEFFSILGNVLLVFIKVIGALVAVSLIIALIAVLIGFLVGGAALFPGGFLQHLEWPGIVNWPELTWTGVCLFLIIVIPILAIFAKLVKWLFNLPSKNHFLSSIAATVWVLALIMFIVLMANNENRGIFRQSFTSEYTIEIPKDKALYIDINPLSESGQYDFYNILGYHFVWDDFDNDFLWNPEIAIEYTNNKSAKIEIEKNFICFNSSVKTSKAQRIADYDWNMSDSMLKFDEYFVCDDDESWRFPHLKVTLFVPDGTRIIYSDDIAPLIDNVDIINNKGNAENWSEKILEMNHDGLHEIN